MSVNIPNLIKYCIPNTLKAQDIVVRVLYYIKNPKKM